MVTVATQVVPIESARRVRVEPTGNIGGNITATNTQKALEQLDTAIQSTKGQLDIITAAGVVTVGALEPGVAINKTVGAVTTVNLPAAAARNGLPVIVKDMKGDANTNNITVMPNGAETIDGNANDVLNINKASRAYRPIVGGWLRT